MAINAPSDTPSIPDDAVDSIYHSVGQVVVNWALLEQSLEQWVAIIYQKAGGKDKDPELPRNFTRKVTFLRKRFSDIANLAPFGEEGASLLDEIVVLGKTRDHIVHGAISRYERDGDALTFVKLDVVDKNTMQKTNTLRLTRADLYEAATTTGNLSSKSIDFCYRLAKVFVP